MKINDLHVTLGNNICGASYVTDKYGGLIGWYSYNPKVLHIDDRYKHTEELLYHCDDIDFQIVFSRIEEPEVLKYFADKRVKMKEEYRKQKEYHKKVEENLKLITKRRKKNG